MSGTAYVLSILASFILALLLRLLPHRLSPQGVGVDHWYWKAWVEEFRRDRAFPPRLPQFLLDAEHWYPPVFPLLVSRLPEAVFDRYSHLIAIVIDMARMALLLLAALWLIPSPVGVVLAAVVYATSPILISYNIQLNPRGLAALLLDAGILLLYAGSTSPLPGIALICAIGVFGLVLLTHKMTTQLLVFLCFGASVVTGDLRPLALIPLAVLCGLAFSRGFYLKVARAHGDIVRFWSRNWRWIGVHPVNDSPAYAHLGIAGKQATHFYGAGLKSLARRVQFLVGFNPWAWGAAVAAVVAFQWGGLSGVPRFAAVWLLLELAMLLLTTYVPALRCFGNGYLYGYNAALPAALTIAALADPARAAGGFYIGLMATGLLAMLSIAAYLHKLRNAPTVRVEQDLRDALSFLAAQPAGPLMCFPQQWHDVAAYFSRQPVVFGGHGYGLSRLLQPVFPRLLEPLDGLVKRHAVRYLLTRAGYLPATVIAALPPSDMTSFGVYQVYCMTAPAETPSFGSVSASAGAIRGID